MVKHVIFQDLGTISYKEAWDYQQQLLEKAIARKRSNRGLLPTDSDYQAQKHQLLFCEHPPVYTLGRKGDTANLLLNEAELEKEGIEFYKINRGGDITYHGPGQLVVYPIFDLECFFTDVHRYVRTLEEIIIRTLSDYGLKGQREKGYTGVWLKETLVLPKRKICAIGVHLSRWVTMHGLAFNVHPNLQHFNHIIPCGIQEEGKSVTSLEVELNQTIELEEVKQKVKHQFAEQFEFEFAATSILTK
ncbi:MAG: lipoyl(octanoyl) transferase LipB [Bacteroidota bacterium]